VPLVPALPLVPSVPPVTSWSMVLVLLVLPQPPPVLLPTSQPLVLQDTSLTPSPPQPPQPVLSAVPAVEFVLMLRPVPLVMPMPPLTHKMIG
jgi:hypothetical protein